MAYQGRGGGGSDRERSVPEDDYGRQANGKGRKEGCISKGDHQLCIRWPRKRFVWLK